MTFTVVIPTRNRSRLLVQAIKSVIAQSLSDWELIIVDDCSTDDTAIAVRPFLSDRVKYVRNHHSLGPGASRNAGIKAAHPDTRYISLLDDDDSYHPDFLKTTYETIRHTTSEIGFAWTGVEYIYPDSNKADTFFWNPGFKNKEEAFDGFLKTRLIGTGYGITFKKEVFYVTGYFDESLRAVEDTDFFLRVLKSFFYKNIPDTLVRITRHSANHVNRDSLEKAMALEIIFSKHKESILRNPTAWYSFKAKISSIYYRLGVKRKGRKILMDAVKERFNIRIVWLWLRLELS